MDKAGLTSIVRRLHQLPTIADNSHLFEDHASVAIGRPYLLDDGDQIGIYWRFGTNYCGPLTNCYSKKKKEIKETQTNT